MNAASKGSNGRKAPKKTLVDHVYHEIQNRILYNIWGTGYQALEQELCEELGVSRTPVREALIRLQRDGLVNVVPRHGMRVLPISATDIQQIYQILTSLESLAVELAAARKLSVRDYKSLDNALKEMKLAQDASDLKAWAQADENFHYHLVVLSGNRILIELVDSFWGRAQRARLTMLSIRNNPIVSTQDHAKIVDAIRRRDGFRARELIEVHRKRGASDLSELMEKHLNILQLS